MKKIIALLMILLSVNVFAAQYKIVVPFAVGSTPDIQTRKIFEYVAKETGDTFIVINKGGAETLIGYKHFLEESSTEKNVIYFSHSSYYIGYMTGEENFSIDKMTKPLVALHKFTYSLVTRKESNLDDISDIKGKLNIGGTTKLCLKAVEAVKNDKELQFVPYASDRDAFLNMIKGDLDLVCVGSATVIYASFKDKTKSIKNFNKVIDFGNTSGFVVSKNMADEDIKRLNLAINNAYRDENIRNWFIEVSGMPPENGTPDNYLRHVRDLKKFLDTHKISMK